MLDEVYAAMLAAETPRMVTDLATAQLVKVAANSFLATKISFINAMAELCEAAGGDVTHLADAIGMDARIGRSFLNAGLGFGGGCLPKDIRAFMARAGELGADQALSFLREVDAINMRRRVRMVDLAREECGGSIAGRRIAVLGAAFKPHSDDVRDSPALSVAAQMQLQGASVVVTDPEAVPNAKRKWPDLTFAASAEEALAEADLVLVLTEWPEYTALDPAAAKTLVAQARVLDGRNCLDADAWRAAGWHYRALGRRDVAPAHDDLAAARLGAHPEEHACLARCHRAALHDASQLDGPADELVVALHRHPLGEGEHVLHPDPEVPTLGEGGERDGEGRPADAGGRPARGLRPEGPPPPRPARPPYPACRPAHPSRGRRAPCRRGAGRAGRSGGGARPPARGRRARTRARPRAPG